MSHSLIDFYSDINHKWLAKSRINSDNDSTSIFDEIEENIKKTLIDLIKKERRQDTPFGKFIESAYTGWHNDIETLKILIEEKTKFTSKDECAQSMGALNLYDIRTPIEIEIEYDIRNTGRYAIYISEPDLGIMKLDYLEKTKLHARYKKFVREIAGLAKKDGLAEISEIDEDFAKIEEHMAQFYPERENLGRAALIYNPMSFSMLCKEFSNINFDALLNGMHIGPEIYTEALFVVANPAYLAEVNLYMKTLTLDKWRSWIKADIIMSLLGVLHGPYKSANFEFYAKFLSGQQVPSPEDDVIFNLCDEMCSDSLGKLYVDSNLEKFTQIRKGAIELKHEIVAAAKERVIDLNWLSEGSKRVAQFKLSKMGHKMAFPDVWYDDFQHIQMDKDTFLLNVLSIRKQATLWDISKLVVETPETRKMWSNGCYDVNAYYYAEMNELCIPLGFLKKPFYSPDAPFIENLAGLGNIMGHEIAHGFDEEGRNFDENGNYFPWWTSIDVELYNTKSKLLINEFDKQKYEGLSVNGTLTLGENLADFGAISICMDVLHNRWKKNNTPKSEQLAQLREYFICYAKSWAYKERKAKREMAVKNDSHAPAQLRVNVVLRHCNEFYEAFGFTEKDEGWIPPEDRINIWGLAKQ